MSYLELIAEHARLTILRVLADAPGYRANESLLHQFLDSVGLPCTRDQVRTHIAWLTEQQLVTTSETVGVVMTTLTERGGDVAAGRATVPGVKRPSPPR